METCTVAKALQAAKKTRFIVMQLFIIKIEDSNIEAKNT
jgi:hypothetical protein